MPWTMPGKSAALRRFAGAAAYAAAACAAVGSWLGTLAPTGSRGLVG